MHDQAVVQTFGRALDREAHNLARWPELVWQQLYNRLQWKEPAPGPLVEEFSRRSAQAGSAWMRLRSPYREASGLLRTLEGHTQGVHCCALAPDGSYLVSGSEDSRLKIWDTSTGTERATLEGHARDVLGCAVAPDGSFVVSASGDGTLRLWDPVSGDELRTLARHTDPVWGCAVAPDCSLVVSASGDKTLKLHDPATGEAVVSMPLLGSVNCVAMHPSLPLAACGDLGGTLYLIEFVGIEYGPIVVTAVDRGAGPTLRCPACWEMFPFDDAWLGQVIDCPTNSCDLSLRVNPFVVTPPSRLRETQVGKSRLAEVVRRSLRALQR